MRKAQKSSAGNREREARQIDSLFADHEQDQLSPDVPQQVCRTPQPLPRERLERVWSWGMASSAMGFVFRPTTLDGIREAFQLAKERGVTVGMRGAGCSYGDASLNSEE